MQSVIIIIKLPIKLIGLQIRLKYIQVLLDLMLSQLFKIEFIIVILRLNINVVLFFNKLNYQYTVCLSSLHNRYYYYNYPFYLEKHLRLDTFIIVLITCIKGQLNATSAHSFNYSTITLTLLRQDTDKDCILEDASNVHYLINKINIVIISYRSIKIRYFHYIYCSL